MGATPYTDLKAFHAAFSGLVLGVKDQGCKLEAQLESVYHFLIQPDPYLTVEREGNAPLLHGVDAHSRKGVSYGPGAPRRERPKSPGRRGLDLPDHVPVGGQGGRRKAESLLGIPPRHEGARRSLEDGLRVPMRDDSHHGFCGASVQSTGAPPPASL